MKRDGFTLIETLAALAILLAFLATIVPALYQAQRGNAQSAFIAASNTITNKISPEFIAQSGPSYARYLALTGNNPNAAGPSASCDQHIAGSGAGSWDLGNLATLNIFSDVTSGDQKGFNDPALYKARVRGYTETLPDALGQRQNFEISVFYPNPSDPSGKENCYSVRVASNMSYSAAP